MQECVLSTDRRSVRTRQALRAALAREIDETGDLSRVTVTAVTERAGVTRRTFYSHFRDIPDLVNQIEEETLTELRDPLARLASCHLDDLREALGHGDPAPGAAELLSCLRARGVRQARAPATDPPHSQAAQRRTLTIALSPTGNPLIQHGCVDQPWCNTVHTDSILAPIMC